MTASAADRPRPSTEPQRVRIELSLRSVLGVLGIIVGLWLLVQLWQIVLLLVVAAVLAGSLNPVIDWLDGHGVKRGVALGLILAALIGAVLGLGALVIPALMAQLTSAKAGLPALQERAVELTQGIPFLGEQVAALAEGSPVQGVAPSAGQALPVAMRVAEVIALGLTAVMLAFYMLADRERTVGFLYALLPRSYHVRTARILLDMERIVGGYVRGQAITSGLMAAFIFGLLWLVGAPSPLAFAVLAALADAIPFIGALLILIPAVLAGLSVSPTTAAIVFVAVVAYQEFESRVLVPRVYGKTLRLSPVAVVVALLVGGKLLGVIGAVLALPLAAGIRVLIEDLRIDLPGEVPGERTERAVEEHAESVYERRAASAPPVEAAQVAAELAAEVHEQIKEEEGGDDEDVPLVQRRDSDSPPTARAA